MRIYNLAQTVIKITRCMPIDVKNSNGCSNYYAPEINVDTFLLQVKELY